MKKFGFMVIAVLAAALIAGCDFTAPEAGGIESSKQVKIAIENYGSAGDRSLFQSVAESDMDYVEVKFRKGTEVRRAGWKVNNIGTITIPEEFDLNNTDCEAVIFGGLNEGKVLLAVGLVSKINGAAATGSNTKIEGGTVTFKMAALTCKVSTDFTATDFLITGGTGVTATEDLTEDIPTLKNKGTEVPVFVLPRQTPDVTAAYKFTFTYKDGSSPTFNDYAQYIINASDSSLRQMGTTLESEYRRAAVSNLSTPGFVQDNALPSVLNITFGTQEDGLCTIFLRIPVYMFGIKDSPIPPDTEPVNHTKWYVQSGLDNSMLDDGSGKWDQETNGTGGSILLGIGAYDYRERSGSEVEIEW